MKVADIFLYLTFFLSLVGPDQPQSGPTRQLHPHHDLVKFNFEADLQIDFFPCLCHMILMIDLVDFFGKGVGLGLLPV